MPPKSRARADEISLGRIVGVFGTRGEVRVHLYNRESTLLHEGRAVQFVDPEGERRELKIRTRPGAGGRVLAEIEGVKDRDEAREWMGWEFVLAKADLPPAEDGTWYHHQVLGLEVFTSGGDSLGRLVEVQESGPTDTWVVRGEEEYFLPAIATVILEVDLSAGRILVEFDK